ncbi:MAG: hypothetical protein JW814_05720 [Candidatus Krumholzibacteriota bacterium]|nr:hypothetical protein [Candidatus Krumholzibacteriota bacterium]
MDLSVPDSRVKPGYFQRRSLGGLTSASVETVDSLKVLFIRVSFSDADFLPGHQSGYYENELRHLAEYYRGASMGRFALDYHLAQEVIRLPFDEKYYGQNDPWDLRVPEIMMSVVDSLDSAYDFSIWDSYAIIHTGQGRETDFLGNSQDQLWSGFIDPEDIVLLLADTLGTTGIPTDDGGPGTTFFIDNIMVLPEEATQDGIIFGSLGIYAYQIGKRLGMVSLYDTSPSGHPDSQGIGAFGLMSYGLYNANGFVPGFPCAFQRLLMGWVEAVDITEGSRVALTDINSSLPGDTALVRIFSGPSEYYLVANRLHDSDLDMKFDFIDLNGNGVPENEDTLRGAEFDFYTTGTTDLIEYIDGEKFTRTGGGIKIWHIDERVIADRLAAGDGINDDPHLKGVDLEEADGIQDMDRPGGKYAYGSFLDSFREGVRTVFDPASLPSSSRNSGIASGISISSISAASRRMTFDIEFDHPDPGETAMIEGDIEACAPVAADIYGNGLKTVFIAAGDAGRGIIYSLDDPAGEEWAGSIEIFAVIDSVRWTGPPVFADIDGDSQLEMIITSTEGAVHLFESDGSAFPVDIDETPGSLDLEGDLVTMPIVIDYPGDPYSEVAVFSSDQDSVFLYLIGMDGPLTGARSAGPGVLAQAVRAGRLVSHPARGLADAGSVTESEGLFIVCAADAGLEACYYPLQDLSAAVIAGVPGRPVPSSMMTISSGDIDRDRYDEAVIPLTGTGLVYFDPYQAAGTACGTILISSSVSTNPSSAALADINEDGILETIIRDSENIHLLSGYGSELSHWPVKVPDEMIRLENGGVPAQPLCADLDGDGGLESLFNIAGVCHLLDGEGRSLSGWPLTFCSTGEATPLILAQGSETCLFNTSGISRIEPGSAGSVIIDKPFSELSRYRLTSACFHEGEWIAFRRDSGGSGRQQEPSGSSQAGSMVDESSFICYPNPVTRGEVNIRILISSQADVTVSILNLEGEKVRSVEKKHDWPVGTVPFEIRIPLEGISSGIYICHMEVAAEGKNWKGGKKIAIIR